MDRLKGIMRAVVQAELGRRTSLDALEATLRDEFGPGVTVEHNDLSPSETMLVVRGLEGPSRHFRVHVTEVL